MPRAGPPSVDAGTERLRRYRSAPADGLCGDSNPGPPGNRGCDGGRAARTRAPRVPEPGVLPLNYTPAYPGASGGQNY